DSAMSVMVFIALYFFVIFASVLILSFSGVSPTEAFSGTIASIGNVGPGIGDIGAMGNYASQPLLAKLIYTVDMFLGRLEIFPILVVAAMLFKRER
ncbi:MAG: TrkH family potassium uptake protein, partial [Bacteroidales bacterium]|nr:TrkH family potassium uptake protein [Bacteroidales bacterium]